MDVRQKIAYKWLPKIGEWYCVTGRIFAFDKLGKLKSYNSSLSDGYRSGEAKDAPFLIDVGTWILITNVTIGPSPGEPAYMEFLIRKDQHGQKDEHSQKLFFLSMYPPVVEPKASDPRSWHKTLKPVAQPK